MKLDAALFAVLSADAGVAAIVGAGPAAKIFPVMVQSGKVAPYIVFSRTKGEDYRTHDALPTIEAMTVELNLFGKTPEAVDALCDAVRAALLPMKGEAPAGSGFVWEAVRYTGLSDSYVADTYTYGADLTLEVMYRV